MTAAPKPPRLEADWLRDPAARAVIAALEAGGARALFVGGCVRNHLLDLPVGDIDMATDAPPQETSRLLKAAGLKVAPTGIEHGTVTAVHDGRGIEITSFRRDVATDGRHAEVAFDAGLEEDAARRDFTMNALYADGDGQLLDPVGEGLADLKRRLLRFIGDPGARIREDYLRILRFFRFHALYGDPARPIDAEGLAACAAEVQGLDGLARERVGAEIRKLLTAADPAPALRDMARCGALARILPAADPARLPPLIEAERAASAPPAWTRRLAALGLTPAEAAARLRLSKAEQRALAALEEAREGVLPPEICAYRLGPDAARDAALLRAAAAEEAPPEDLSARIAKGVSARFPISARDLIARGFKPGPALGRRLKALEADWLASGFAASRETLLARI